MSRREDFFATEYLHSDLRGRSVRGGAISVAAQAVRLMMRLGSTVVLARLLMPRDFGLVAMATAVTGFLGMFKDIGLTLATVQQPHITDKQVSNLFWVNLVVSTGVMLVTAALAPLIAWFYGKPEVLWITVVLAVGFVFGGLTAQHQGLLRRQMRFSALAGIEVFSLAVGVATGILCALLGMSHWSIVLMLLATELAGAGASWTICVWRPLLPSRGTPVRSMLIFGGNLTGATVINCLARSLDKFLIGKCYGPGALGFYSKAFELLLLPLYQLNIPLSTVAVPTLSRLQDDPARYRNFYMKTVSLLATVSIGGMMFLIAMADEIILVVLGDQWARAAGVFAVLGIFGLVSPVANALGWLYISTGQTDRMLKITLLDAGMVIVAVAGGLSFGIMGVAAGYVAARVAIFLPAVWYSTRNTPVSMVDVLKCMRDPLVGSGLMGAAVYGLNSLVVDEMDVWVRLTVCTVASLAVYFAALCAIARGMGPLFELRALAAELFAGGRKDN